MWKISRFPLNEASLACDTSESWFSDVSYARLALPAFSGDCFLFVDILADWLTQRRSSSLQSLLLCVRRLRRSSEHRLLASGALADKKRLCPDRQGWYSHFSWAPTSVIGFEKRDWWRTSLSVAWCFSPRGSSFCVPRPSISLASHEPACVSCEPLCTPGEVAAAGARQSFWSLSWLTSFFSFFLPCCAAAPAGNPFKVVVLVRKVGI